MHVSPPGRQRRPFPVTWSAVRGRSRPDGPDGCYEIRVPMSCETCVGSARGHSGTQARYELAEHEMDGEVAASVPQSMQSESEEKSTEKLKTQRAPIPSAAASRSRPAHWSPLLLALGVLSHARLGRQRRTAVRSSWGGHFTKQKGGREALMQLASQTSPGWTPSPPESQPISATS